MPEKQFFTVREFAAFARVTEKTVANWIRGQRLEAVRFGSRIRIPAEAVTRFAQIMSDERQAKK